MKSTEDRLGRDTKFGRVFSLLKEFSGAVRGNRKYSFTKGCVDHKVRWCANALSFRSVMIRAGFIEQSVLAGIYKFTELGEDIKLSEMANILIDKIDGKEEHLSTYVSDIDKSILKDPPEEDADLENNISDFRKKNEVKNSDSSSPFTSGDFSHKKDFIKDIIKEPEISEMQPFSSRVISKSDAIDYMKARVLKYYKIINHLQETISLLETE